MLSGSAAEKVSICWGHMQATTCTKSHGCSHMHVLRFFTATRCCLGPAYCLSLAFDLQITAGEQIDHAFGAKLGLSSMAAAGLGNTVADVVGINISHTIEVSTRRYLASRLGYVIVLFACGTCCDDVTLLNRGQFEELVVCGGASSPVTDGKAEHQVITLFMR